MVCLILLLIKTQKEKKDILKDIKKNELKYWNKSGIDTASFWIRFLLWEKPTIEASYNYIKEKYL